MTRLVRHPRFGPHARRLAPALLALSLALLAPAGAHGRPGGGHSYSGSHSSRSSSSGSSSHSWGGGSSFSGRTSTGVTGDEAPTWVLVLFIGVCIVVVVLVYPRYLAWKRRMGLEPSEEEEPPAQAPAPYALRSVRQELEQLRQIDPDFSLVLFQDFLYALYAQAHEARGRGGKLAELAPYLSESAREALLAGSHPDEVKGVIVGAMRFTGVDGIKTEAPRVEAEVEFEANYTEVFSGTERTLYAVERWTLVRGKKAHSRAPDKVRAFVCPSCGAPLSALRGNTCSYCKRVVDTGEFDWLVSAIRVITIEPRGALFSQGEVEEVGTNLPTIADPRASSRLEALKAKDPAFTWPALEARVGLVFGELQLAWSNREWTHARPYVSDRLFQSLSGWIEAYRKARLRNVTENGVVRQIELCRVDSDRWYDAVTVRVHANSLDYTVSDDGKLEAGSRTVPRAYTEYWTLIRGAQVKRAPSAEKSCPQCGAPIQIDMAGSCQYCHAKVASGDFDWVLSLIEQDESYRG